MIGRLHEKQSPFMDSNSAAGGDLNWHVWSIPLGELVWKPPIDFTINQPQSKFRTPRLTKRVST